MARTHFHGDQYEEVYPPCIERTWWQVARCRVIMAAVCEHVPRSTCVPEIGCHTGIAVTFSIIVAPRFY